MNCKECKHWKEDKSFEYLDEDRIGTCSGMEHSEMVDIELDSGNYGNGAVISKIETNAYFYCALWRG